VSDRVATSLTDPPYTNLIKGAEGATARGEKHELSSYRAEGARTDS